MKKIVFDEIMIASLPKSIDDAILLESKYYFSTVSCPVGHLPIRITNENTCFFCKRERTRKSAKNRRIKLGIKPQNKLQPLKEGEIFKDLIATGKSKREKRIGALKSTFFIEVKCKCGKIYWLVRLQWGKTPRCRSCRSKLVGTIHGLAYTQQYKLFHSARNRALKNKIDFNIDLNDIEINEYCPILGIKLDLTIRKESGNRKPRENAPSLDRIDSTKGYIPGNILVVSYRANVLKKDGASKEHELIASYLKLKFQNG